MRLQVKSNGKIVEMKKETFDKLPQDTKLGYIVLSKVDAPVKKDEPVKNEVKTPPPSGEKKS